MKLQTARFQYPRATHVRKRPSPIIFNSPKSNFPNFVRCYFPPTSLSFPAPKTLTPSQRWARSRNHPLILLQSRRNDGVSVSLVSVSPLASIFHFVLPWKNDTSMWNFARVFRVVFVSKFMILSLSLTEQMLELRRKTAFRYTWVWWIYYVFA